MAWTATNSGLYVATFRDALNGTIALDLDLASSQKLALYNNTETPDYLGNSTQTAFSTTNEVTGTNWASTGVVLAGLALNDSGPVGTLNVGTLTFDANDVSVANVTLSAGAYGAKIYADNLTPKRLVCGITFGGSSYQPNAGTFSITWSANGIFALDMTP